MRQICAVRGCQAIALQGERHCATHKREREDSERARKAAIDAGRRDEEARKLIRSRRWTELSRRYRAEHPYCEICLAQDPPLYVASEEVDHIERAGADRAKFFDPTNWQALCKICHSRKTATEDSTFARPGEVRRKPGVG